VVTADEAGVVVPAELAGLVDKLLGYGLDTLQRHNGAAPTVAGLEGLRVQLQLAAASASGRPRRILAVPVAPTRELTVAEAAAAAGLSARQVRRLAEGGALIARKRGRDWLVDADSATGYGRSERWQGRQAA
jgi:hypothetical protein